MNEKYLNNNNDEVLEGQLDIDDVSNTAEVNVVSESEVWNKEEAIKENLSEQLGRAGKRVKANLNRIKEELGVDKLNTALAELIEFYEKRPIENNGIDIKKDIAALNKSKEIIENIINSVNSKTVLFESEVLGKTREVQSQIDLSIKSFTDALNEINDRFEENVKEQEEINSSLKGELQEALKEIESYKDINSKLNKDLAKIEVEIDEIKAAKAKAENETANALEDMTALKKEINTLYEAKKDNERLNKENHKLNQDLSTKDSSINDLEERNKSLTKDNESLKTELDVVKEEKRDLILKHKEELIDIKEQIKEEAEKKYEEKIDKLKDEIYDLKKELESLKNNKGKN